ncbi:hypothetical protein HK098_006917 [Nowakowskiella sp. JEL0407]|nr:hypothetical protein HK098_006917 [Nowakowskiella sp. JEL0407]
MTQISHSELNFTTGTELLRINKVRDPGATRVYASCCQTPIYRSGMAVLTNTNVIPEEKRTPIDLEILGRDAVGPHDTKQTVYNSVPWFWPFKMMGRAMSVTGKKEDPFDYSKLTPEILNLPTKKD